MRGVAVHRLSDPDGGAVSGRRPNRPGLASAMSLAVTGCFTLMIAVCSIIAAQPITGIPTRGGPGRTDQRFPTVNVVSGTPVDWVAAICAPRIPFVKAPIDPMTVSGALLLSPSTGLSLPGSTFHAACIAKERTAAEPLLLVTQYPTEDLMQRDLARNGFQWYCFAAANGRLFVTATRAKDTVMDNGWSVSPVLQPLAKFGFNIYSDPGH
jgi:hypothetical protein